MNIHYPYDFQLKSNNNFNYAYKYIEGNLPPLNYSIFRSKAFKKVWKLSTITSSESQVFLELIPNFISYLFANIKCIDEYYISRQKSPRKKLQTQFDKKNFKLLIQFIYLNLYKKKEISHTQYIKIINLLKKRKKKETDRLKYQEVKINNLKFFRLFKLIYLLIFKNPNFNKKNIKHYILKYPKVLNEIENTISRD